MIEEHQLKIVMVSVMINSNLVEIASLRIASLGEYQPMDIEVDGSESCASDFASVCV